MCDHGEIHEDASEGHVYCLKCRQILQHKIFIEDSSTGDTICMSCGLVLDKSYTFEAYSCISNKSQDERLSKTEEEIKTLLTCLFIDNQAIEDEVASIFKHIEEKVEKAENVNTSKRRKTHLAYAIWRALSIHRHPRSMDEIAQLCEVKEKQMLKVEKSLVIRQIFSPLADYVERVIDTLQLPYWLNKVMRQLLQSKQIVSVHKPVNIIAALLSQVCKIITELKAVDHEQNNLSLMYYMLDKSSKTHNTDFRKWQVGEICNNLKINKAVVQRIMRKYSINMIKNILESQQSNTYYYY